MASAPRTRLIGEALDERLRGFLSEDVGSGDITTELTVPPATLARGTLIARSGCVVSGLPVARRTFELLDSGLTWIPAVQDGERVPEGTTLAHLSGRARAILTAERVALNLLQRMCGIATATRRLVEAVEGTSCRILDTRKTAPGLRAFDRAAVVDGGGANHRWGLFDMVLIKDNHRRLAGGVARAVAAARRAAPPGMTIEVEVETETELEEALDAGADAVLIDNQQPETIRRWVAIARRRPSPPSLEASGNLRLENVRRYALTGVDSISVGALTHSVSAADIALELERP
jgi:nicotinate-nucleotide pyrophosphorylase (carboxylating)